MESHHRVLAKICTLKEYVWPEKNDRMWYCNEHDFIGFATNKNVGNSGSKIIFVETDAVSKKKLGFKSPLKTFQIQQFVVQGAILPLNVLPETIDGIMRENLPELFDVTDILEITKFVDDDIDNINKQPNFPSDTVPQTDEDRVENWLKKLKKYSRKIGIDINQMAFFETEKMDGSSFTAYLNDNNEMIVASKNRIVDSNNIMYKTAINRNINTYLQIIRQNYGLNLALQGEICGPTIQQNKYKLINHDIYFYKMFNIDTKEFLDYNNFLRIAKEISLQTIPILSDDYVITDISTLKNHVKGFSAINNNTVREGSVFVINSEKTFIDPKKITEITKIMGFHQRLSFKAISTDYLLLNK